MKAVIKYIKSIPGRLLLALGMLGICILAIIAFALGIVGIPLMAIFGSSDLMASFIKKSKDAIIQEVPDDMICD